MKPYEVLIDKNLKRTSCREGILEVIQESGEALSENEIRERLSGTYDRTTFYRTFKTLQRKSILHKIVVDNQMVKYALDNSITMKKEHAHFFCTVCHTVRCLDSVEVRTPLLPQGYTATCTEVIIKGVCGNCPVNP